MTRLLRSVDLTRGLELSVTPVGTVPSPSIMVGANMTDAPQCTKTTTTVTEMILGVPPQLTLPVI